MWQYILTSLEQPPVQNEEYSKSFTPGGIPIPRVAPAERIWASCCLSFLLTVNLKPAQHNSTQMRQFQQAIKYIQPVYIYAQIVATTTIIKTNRIIVSPAHNTGTVFTYQTTSIALDLVCRYLESPKIVRWFWNWKKNTLWSNAFIYATKIYAFATQTGYLQYLANFNV